MTRSYWLVDGEEFTTSFAGDGCIVFSMDELYYNEVSQEFVETLEECLLNEGIINKPAEKEYLPMQPGDVYQTYADVDELVKDFNFKPSTSLKDGLSRYAKWYKEFYQL